MKQFFTGLFVFSTVILSSQNESRLTAYAAEVIHNEKQEVVFVRLKSAVTEKEAENFINKVILAEADYNVSATKTEKDELGWSHTRYKVLYQGLPLQNKMIISHSQNGKLISVNGDLTISTKPGNSFGISETQALNAALKKINAKKYKWENKEEERHMQQVLNQPDFSYEPKATKVIFEKEGKAYFAFQFTIYAEEPLYKANVIVDGLTGKLLDEQNLICTVDVPGIALTKYSSTQTLTCDQNAGVYTLKETQRGNGIETYNLNNTAVYASNNFTNSSSTWTTTGVNQAATDAHWGAEKTYDYYMTQHNRNSIDNNGFKLLSYLHYNTNYANAFWDGTRMTYGDGNGTSTYIFTTIDICGHEISHGLTSNTSNLNYNNESGALNESYSDIFGTCIENYSRPSNWNWKVGEQMTANGNGIRSMSNPNQFTDPDTYNGQYWYVGTADNGGVHTNSGVSNFWFYLLSMGGNGVNDISNAYSVSGLGISNAAKIAFRALTVYYTPSTNYAMARTLSIQAAKDIFGICSNEVTQTTNAWYAVGVGTAFVPGLIGPNFIAPKTNYCTVPAVVNFNNTSNNGITYAWNFGDGTIATSTNAVHTYTANGTYSVKLKATGCSNGLDSIIKPSYIVVNAPAVPIGIGAGACANSSCTLSASGNSVIKWFAGSNATSPIGIGNTFVIPNLTTTSTYYAANTFSNPSAFGGMLSNTGGGNLNNAAQWLTFDVSQNSTLNSVVVYASTAGNRTIEMRDQFNAVLNSTTASLSIGTNTVVLNYFLTPGSDYQLGLSSTSASNLFRSNTGVTYPYSVAGSVSIKGSSAGNGYYYWFYKWEVTEADCSSPLIPVTATLLAVPQVSISAASTVVCMNDEVALSGSPTGGSFVGNGVTGSTFIPPNSSGNYYVTYQYNGPNGCQGTDSLMFQISECTGITSMNKQTASWLLYPNPAHEKIILQFNSLSSVSFEITDAAGRSILKKSNVSSGETINISYFTQGLYLIRLKEDASGNTKTFKLTKE